MTRGTMSVAGVALATLAAAAAVGASASLDRAPTPSIATVVGDGAVVRFDRALVGAPPASAFVVTIDGRPSLPTSVTVSGRSIRLVLPVAVYSDDAVRVRYAPFRVNSTRRLRDGRGRPVAGFAVDATNRGPTGCMDPLGTVAARVANEAPTDTSFFLPSTGRLGTAWVPVDFGDTYDGGYQRVPIRTEVPAGLAPIVASLSYGKLSLPAAPPHGVVRMSKESAKYALGYSPTFEEARPYLTEAMAIASNTADYSRTDIVFLEHHPRSGTPVPSGLGDSPTLFPMLAAPGQGITVDGHEIRAFVFVLSVRGADTYVRPVLQLLGLPNLRQRSDQLGGWDAMAQSEPDRMGLLGWHRRKLGWIDPTQTRCVREKQSDIVIQPLTRSGGVQLILAPLSSTSAVAVEVRRKEGTEVARCGSGVLVSRVDTKIPLVIPLVVPPIRIVTTRPFAGAAPYGSPLFGCDYLYEQVLDAAFPVVVSDSVTVQLVRENSDGSALVRISR